MTNLFLPYELCLEMRDLGFTESCLATYRSGSLYSYLTGYESEGGWDEHYSAGDENQWVSAVLWQQAFNWLLTNPKICNVKGSFEVFELSVPDYTLTSKQNKNKVYAKGKEECIEFLIELLKS